MKKFMEYLLETNNYRGFVQDRMARAMAAGVDHAKMDFYRIVRDDQPLAKNPFKKDSFAWGAYEAGYHGELGKRGVQLKGMKHMERVKKTANQYQAFQMDNSWSELSHGGNFSDKKNNDVPKFFNHSTLKKVEKKKKR